MQVSETAPSYAREILSRLFETIAPIDCALVMGRHGVFTVTAHASSLHRDSSKELDFVHSVFTNWAKEASELKTMLTVPIIEVESVFCHAFILPVFFDNRVDIFVVVKDAVEADDVKSIEQQMRSIVNCVIDKNL